MKSFIVTLVSFLLLSFIGCGEKAKEVAESAENLKNLAQSGNKMEQLIQRDKERREERRKSGDTLAMDFKKLQTYLPASVSGYTAQEPEGSSFNFGEASYATAGIKFTKGEGDNSQDVEVNIHDYNGAEGMYTGVFAIWSVGWSVDNANETAKTFDTGIQDVYGFERLDKKNKSAEVTLGVGGRFVISVKASNQNDCDFVKSIANSMKLRELAQK